MAKRNYELMVIVSAELGDEEKEALLQRVQQYLENAEAEVFTFKEWGLRKLAYPIKKNREGRYYLVHFAGNPLAISELERSLLLTEGVLRHMVTRLEKLPEVKQTVVQEESAEPSAPPPPAEPVDQPVDEG